MKPFRTLHRLAAAFFALLLPSVLHAADRVRVLYDVFSDAKEITKDWGFSALAEHDGKRILFDCGNNAEIFERNVKALRVDLTKLDFVVTCHRHGDHTTGLKYLLKVNPAVPVYVPREGAGMFGGHLPSSFLRPAASLPGEDAVF